MSLFSITCDDIIEFPDIGNQSWDVHKTHYRHEIRDAMCQCAYSPCQRQEDYGCENSEYELYA